MLVGKTWVGFDPLVAVGVRVAVGDCGGRVFAGELGVGVAVFLAVGVGLDLLGLVGVISPGFSSSGAPVGNTEPGAGKVGVDVGLLGVIWAMPLGLPVSGAGLTPSKSSRISNPMAGTDSGISSTP